MKKDPSSRAERIQMNRNILANGVTLMTTVVRKMQGGNLATSAKDLNAQATLRLNASIERRGDASNA